MTVGTTLESQIVKDLGLSQADGLSIVTDSSMCFKSNILGLQVGHETRPLSVAETLNDVRSCFQIARNTQTWEWPRITTPGNGYDLQDLQVVNLLRGGETDAHGAAKITIGCMAENFAWKYSPYLSVRSGNAPCGGCSVHQDFQKACRSDVSSWNTVPSKRREGGVCSGRSELWYMPTALEGGVPS